MGSRASKQSNRPEEHAGKEGKKSIKRRTGPPFHGASITGDDDPKVDQHQTKWNEKRGET